MYTVAVDEVGQVQVQLSNGDVDVVWVNAESRMETVGRLFQPFAVGALQRNGFEQDDHHQIKSPNLNEAIIIIRNSLSWWLGTTVGMGYLIGLSETIDASHFALLVRVGEDAHGRFLARDAQHKVFATFLRDVLAQFA